jgi:hypothetical protein
MNDRKYQQISNAFEDYYRAEEARQQAQGEPSVRIHYSSQQTQVTTPLLQALASHNRACAQCRAALGDDRALLDCTAVQFLRAAARDQLNAALGHMPYLPQADGSAAIPRAAAQRSHLWVGVNREA